MGVISMAIVIPSKNTYDRQNPKVRDNVIERIEVGAVEVVPNNEYETPVYNEAYSNVFQQSETQTDREADADGYGQIMYEAYIEATPTHAFINEINIPIQYNEFSIIEKILTGENKNKESNIKFSIVGNFYKGTATQTVTVDTTPSATGNTYGEIIYSNPTEKEEGIRYEFPKTIEKIASSGNGLYEATAKVEIKDLTNLKSVSVEPKDSSFAIKNIYILSGVSFVSLKSIHSFPVETGGSIYSYTREGEYEQYIPTQIEITVYGNTIGIDLQDKTVHINGETQKKVHSVDGNELMQTSNYFDQNGTKVNAIDKMYGETQSEYAIGKETATIRCSISDYFNEEGEKVISTDFIKNVARLPSEYQEVEYIESKNSQYIDTGVKAAKNTRVVLDYQFTSVGGGSALFGASDNVIGSPTSASYAYYIGGVNLSSDFGDNNITTTRSADTDRHTVDKDGGFLYIDNVLVAAQFVDYSFETSSTINIFGCSGLHSGSLANGLFVCSAKVYSCKIYENDIIVRDFIPCYRKADGVCGLYDLEGEKFYSSGSMNNFLGGDIVLEVDKLKMSFEIGDRVIPKVYGADGKDYPMSTYLNGDEKVFEVLGTKKIYDGAVWQELSLQEV